MLGILVPTQKHSYTNSDNIKLPSHLSPHSPPFLKPLPHLLIESRKTLIKELEQEPPQELISLESRNPNSRTRARTARRIYKARTRSCSHGGEADIVGTMYPQSLHASRAITLSKSHI